jgi:dUTP pyrophosphatase
MLYTLRVWIFKAIAWLMSPPVRIYVLPGGRLPERQTDGAIGYDAYARAIVSAVLVESPAGPTKPQLRKLQFDFEHLPTGDSEDEKWVRRHISPKRDENGYLVLVVYPGEQVLVGVGFIIEMPYPMFHWVAPRSGLATKDYIQVTNAPGTVDPDYRGEAGVAIKNFGMRPFKIKRHMRIAQILFGVAPIPELREVHEFSELTSSARGGGGFGSTGTEANRSQQGKQARR